jgi:hypothetical protein
MCGLDGGDSGLDQSEQLRYCRRLVQYCDTHRSRLTPRGVAPPQPPHDHRRCCCSCCAADYAGACHRAALARTRWANPPCERANSSRVPDAVQRSSRCSAEPGPISTLARWTPDQQRTTPRRAARCAASGERTLRAISPTGYFDVAGFPGRTLGLEAGKQKTAGK